MAAAKSAEIQLEKPDFKYSQEQRFAWLANKKRNDADPRYSSPVGTGNALGLYLGLRN